LHQISDSFLNVLCIPSEVVLPYYSRHCCCLKLAWELIRREETTNLLHWAICLLSACQEVSILLCLLCLIVVVVGLGQECNEEVVCIYLFLLLRSHIFKSIKDSLYPRLWNACLTQDPNYKGIDNVLGSGGVGENYETWMVWSCLIEEPIDSPILYFLIYRHNIADVCKKKQILSSRECVRICATLILWECTCGQLLFSDLSIIGLNIRYGPSDVGSRNLLLQRLVLIDKFNCQSREERAAQFTVGAGEGRG
jgi:hypothetical protein